MTHVPTRTAENGGAEKDAVCSNCGHSLQADDQFCAQCGQSTKDLHRPFSGLVQDFLSVELGWDAKLWSTLRRLIFKPGALTLELMEGRRRGQVPPVRLYFFISVVYFLLLNNSVHREFERIGRERYNNEHLLDAQDTIRLLGVAVTVHDADLIRGMTEAQLDSMMRANGHEPDGIDRFLMRRAARFTDLRSIEHASALMLQNLSYLLFLLMPLMALMLWLFFRRRRPWYIDHLFLAIHVHCYFFLVQTVLHTIDLLTPITTWGLSIPALLIHLPMAVKRTYGMRWRSTIVRSMLVLLLQLFFLLAAFVAATVLTIIRI